MNRLNKPQRDKLTQFRAITGCNDRIGVQCLQAAGWLVEGGIDVFYSSHIAAAPSVDRNAIEGLFQQYKAPYDDVIEAEGVGRFIDDLSLEPEDVVLVVLSWHFSAATMCEYSRDEFVQGMEKLSCDSIPKLQAKLPELRAELKDENKYRDIYEYAYMFSRDKGKKCLQLDTAVGMWKLLFAERKWPLVDDWCEFLYQHHNRAISKDTWVELLDFSKTVKLDFSNFDANGAWPYLLDEFVEWRQGGKKASS